MTAVVITVNGQAEEFHPPQRATAQVQLGLHGKAKQEVAAQIRELAHRVAADIADRHDPDRGPITWYSQSAPATWAEKPWNKDGKQLPVVHHARIVFQVKFADFSVLAGWIDDWAEVAGISLTGIEWTLTEAHQQSVSERVRAAAVGAARAKAQAYADSLELGPVHPVALADSGLLAPGLVSVHPAAASFRSRGAGDATPAGIIPEDVPVQASVDARFETG